MQHHHLIVMQAGAPADGAGFRRRHDMVLAAQIQHDDLITDAVHLESVLLCERCHNVPL